MTKEEIRLMLQTNSKGAVMQHRFDIYGQQRSWRRVKAEAFPLIEEQLALPDGWA